MPEHIRLREKTVERLGKVLPDTDLMKDHSLIDNKQLGVQLIGTPEEVKQGDVFTVVREWDS